MKILARTVITHQALVVVFAGVFLFAAVFSVTFGMRADEYGNMSGCPFILEHPSVCPMDVFEHIAKWQRLFTGTFSQSSDLAFLILLFLSFAFFIVFTHAPNISPFVLASSPLIPQNKPETKLFNYFVTVFSQGILNSRLYA